jgi:hypothetical protein
MSRTIAVSEHIDEERDQQYAGAENGSKSGAAEAEPSDPVGPEPAQRPVGGERDRADTRERGDDRDADLWRSS